MNSRQKDINLLIALVIILFAINYSFLDNSLKNILNEQEEVYVDRIIDGDTIEIKGRNESVRLLGINTPERGEVFYEEAKEFLEWMILNKSIVLKFGRERYDKYGRTLAYIFLDGKNVNKQIIESGFANYYFPKGKDKYYEDFLASWQACIEKNVNLCQKSESQCAPCIILKDSKTLFNGCTFSCDVHDWEIKTEGRENIILAKENFGGGEELAFNLNLTKTGDTVFLRDGSGKLILWKRF